MCLHTTCSDREEEREAQTCLYLPLLLPTLILMELPRMGGASEAGGGTGEEGEVKAGLAEEDSHMTSM